jgi:quercetin dioxygenase-like cupin family protein
MNYPTQHLTTQKRVFENPVFGDKATFLKTADETGGAYTLIEIELAPGGGNSLHTHTQFTETFRPKEGPITLECNKIEKTLQPGESFTVPKKAVHLFKNPTEKKVILEVELRPGNAGFEKAIKIAYGLATDGLTNKKGIPTNFFHLAILSSCSGTIPAGFISVIVPLMKWVATRARKKGIEQELIKKYCL